MYSAELGRFASRDPVGYEDGVSVYRAYFADHSVDPTGTVSIDCECSSGGGGMAYHQIDWVTVGCRGLAANCCERACDGGKFDDGSSHWTGNWKIVPGHDAYDDALKDYNAAVFEIMLCCMPMPGGVGASGTRFCARATGRILKTKRGHYILEYIWNGRKHYAHMPGWHFIGDKVCDRGCGSI